MYVLPSRSGVETQYKYRYFSNSIPCPWVAVGFQNKKSCQEQERPVSFMPKDVRRASCRPPSGGTRGKTGGW